MACSGTNAINAAQNCRRAFLRLQDVVSRAGMSEKTGALSSMLDIFLVRIKAIDRIQTRINLSELH